MSLLMWNWFKFKFFRRPWMEMSFGELIDLRAILRVKSRKIMEHKNILDRLEKIDKYLEPAIKYYIRDNTTTKILLKLMRTLELNHYKQWECENEVFEAQDIYKGILAAKNSRTLNVYRSQIKKQIDILFGIKSTEIKKYSARKEPNGVI